MSALIDVILPVFLIIGFGYLAARAQWINYAEIDGIMRFAQGFAAPVLLFKNIATIDLATAFQPGLLLSFYIGAFTGFALGFCAARFALACAGPCRPAPLPPRVADGPTLGSVPMMGRPGYSQPRSPDDVAS